MCIRDSVCTVDESALTGASRPVEKAVGDAVLAGTLDRAGSASVTPTAVGDATVLQRTIAALQRAQTVRTPERERLERAASRTVRRCGWLLLAYHAVCLPLAACGVIGPAAAAVLACGASGGVLLYALRGNGTKGERP